MPTYPFMQVDAFTRHPMGGNPCAILFEADDLDVATMQALAREMNLSETAFVRRSDVADFGVRYFTPAEEVPLAGHPTIATTYALVETGRAPLNGNPTRLTLELQVGPITVDVYSTDGVVTNVVMTQKKPAFLEIHDPEEVLPIFGLASGDLVPDVPIQTVSTGTPQLMLPLRTHDALRNLHIDQPALTALRRKAHFFSTHLFCVHGLTPGGRTFARHFATPPDLFEDPFTGSATGGMGAYLWHYGLIDTPSFVAEQGHWMHRPGQATVECIGPREDIEAVKVGGSAATIIRGEVAL